MFTAVRCIFRQSINVIEEIAKQAGQDLFMTEREKIIISWIRSNCFIFAWNDAGIISQRQKGSRLYIFLKIENNPVEECVILIR